MTIESLAVIREQPEIDPTRLLAESGALLFGTFTLKSGKVSEYYFDSKKLTLDPQGALFVATQLVRKLDTEGIRHVGGVAYGGIPIVSHVALLSGLREGEPIRAFYHRKDSKEHGTAAAAEGQLPEPGSPVAILEDVVTTGGSLMETIALASESGWNVTHALTIVDRDEGGREAIEAAGYEFWSLFRVERTDGKVNFAYNGG